MCDLLHATCCAGTRALLMLLPRYMLRKHGFEQVPPRAARCFDLASFPHLFLFFFFFLFFFLFFSLSCYHACDVQFTVRIRAHGGGVHAPARARLFQEQPQRSTRSRC